LSQSDHEKKIIVLHTFHPYLNNSENWIYRILNNLINVEIVIASKQFLKNPFYPDKFQYIRFPFQRLNSDKETVLTEFTGKFSMVINHLFYKTFLYHSVKKIRINLIHSHFAPVGWQYRAVSRKLRTPHIISFYGYDYEQLPALHPEWNRRYKILFEEADAFICEGEYAASLLQSKGCPAEKIHIVHLGADIAKIPFFSRIKNPDELHLLQIAALTPKKGHKYTIKSFIQALEICPDMTLTIVGPDKDGIKQDLLDELHDDKNREKITFLDSIDFDHLYDFMENYQVFIHPSIHTEDHNSEGGAPVVLVDAQATGMPVISTYHCDIPEEVLNGETGVLVPEKDIAGLSKAIQFFYEMDNDKYQKYSNSARKHVENEYNIKKTAESLRTIYQTVLENYQSGTIESSEKHR